MTGVQTCALPIFHSRGIRLIGTSQNASRPVFDCDLTTPAAIVIGNEGSGIRPELLEACDELVKIPQFGAVESLNAAVSAGVLFYEAQRQRATQHSPTDPASVVKCLVATRSQVKRGKR